MPGYNRALDKGLNNSGKNHSSSCLLRIRRPFFFSASESIHCICPFTERNSSAAHFSMASIVFSSIRSTKLLLEDFSFAIVMFPLQTNV